VSGFLVQSRFGSQGNFEVVVPARSQPGIVHFWRNNDDPSFPWSGPTAFGGALGNVDGGVSMIESNFGSPGNLEVVAVVGNNLYAFWRDSGPAFAWNGPSLIAGGVAGIPGLIQSRFGAQGNFELVVPSASGGLLHFWRNNDDPSFPWSAPTPFGAALGNVDAVSVIQSNFGSPGNLEVVTSAAGNVSFFWRDSGPSFTWNGPFALPGIQGFPALIQSRFGIQGNFELVVNNAGGGLVHFWRNNDDPTFPWSGPTPFGMPLTFGVPSLIQSNFGSPGNLEVVAGTFDPASGADQLAHLWRDSGPAFTWSGPFVFASGI
jgi:hypothetical protein